MSKRQWLLFLLLFVPGTICFLVCLRYALLDWDALQKAYAHFASVASRPDNFNALFIAEARQNIHRINLFADGVWSLLGAVVAAIGLHGLCTIQAQKENK